MKLTRLIILCVISSVAACSSAPISVASAKSDVAALAKAYVSAQASFDQATIRKITGTEFVEVSPKGEVDERDAVISFYDPEKRSAAPPFSVENQKVRVNGDIAVITQTLIFGTPPRSMSLTQALTATRVNGKWLLQSSQTTPLPPQNSK